MKINKKLLAHSFGHALLTILYILGVAGILFNSQHLFKQHDTFFTPVAVLTLLVVSASIEGALVLGRPVLLYLDGKKSEAIKMFGYTVGWLVLAAIIFLGMNLK